MFYCHASKEMVSGEGQVLVPVQIRKVQYIGTVRVPPRVKVVPEPVITEGWEIVKEVPVAFSKATSFIAQNRPEIVKEKIVNYIKPYKKIIHKIEPVRADYEEMAEKYN